MQEGTPIFSSPTERGSSKDQVPGERRGGGDGDPPSSALGSAAPATPWWGWGLVLCPPPDATSCLAEIPSRWLARWLPGDQDKLEARAGFESSFTVGFVVSWERCGGLYSPLSGGGGIFLHCLGCNGEESGQVSGQALVAASAPSPRFARAPARFCQPCAAQT